MQPCTGGTRGGNVFRLSSRLAGCRAILGCALLLGVSNAWGGQIWVVNLKDNGAEVLQRDGYQFEVKRTMPSQLIVTLRKPKEPVPPWFIRVRPLRGAPLINGYMYGAYARVQLQEGVYSIYLKDAAGKEMRQRLLIIGEEAGGRGLRPREVVPVRDRPLTKCGMALFAWFPIRFGDMQTEYLLTIRTGAKMLVRQRLGRPGVRISAEILARGKAQWSVVAYPAELYRALSPTDRRAYLRQTQPQWWPASAGTGYVFGIEVPKQGPDTHLPLFYPSSIAFFNDGEDFLVSNGDRGELVYVGGGRYHMRRYRDESGMPGKLTGLSFVGGERFIFADNRNHVLRDVRILRDARKIGDSHVISGRMGILRGQEVFERYVGDPTVPVTLEVERRMEEGIQWPAVISPDEPLGIVNGLSVSGDMVLSMMFGFQPHSRSWYRLPFGQGAVYAAQGAGAPWKRLEALRGFCRNHVCGEVLRDGDRDKWYVRTKARSGSPKGIFAIERSGRLKWQVPLKSGFGKGLALYRGRLIVGDHTRLLSVVPGSGAAHELMSNVKFANVVDVKVTPEGRLAVVDSDAFRVHFGNVVEGKFTVKRTLGAGVRYPNVVSMKAAGGRLYVLTSNPSYLFEYDPQRNDLRFLVGNGTNAQARVGATGLETGLYFPNDFSITDRGIFISEANHRVLLVTPSGHIARFAGTLKPGRGAGPCHRPLFRGVRGLEALEDGSMIAVDSGNARLVRLRRSTEGRCQATEIVLVDREGKTIRLRFPTRITRVAEGYAVTDQNNNRVLIVGEWTSNRGVVTRVIGRTLGRPYQGMGSYVTNVGETEAMFNTPTTVVQHKDTLYIGDMFNGLIRCAYQRRVGDVVIRDPGRRVEYMWANSLASVAGRLYVSDALGGKISVHRQIDCSVRTTRH